MAGDTRDHAGNALMLFTQQVGVPDKLVNNNNQDVSGLDTKWDQICCENYIRKIITDTYIHW